jgi:hypothetical protein
MITEAILQAFATLFPIFLAEREEAPSGVGDTKYPTVCLDKRHILQYHTRQESCAYGETSGTAKTRGAASTRFWH